MKAALGGLLLVLFALSAGVAEILPGQAVSWSEFSHVTCIAIGYDYAYFGTTEGILRYHRFDRQWNDPITVSDGLQGKAIRRLAVSFDDQELTVETDQGIFTYDKNLESWFLEPEFPTENYRDSRPTPPLPRLLMPTGFQMYPEGFIEDSYFRQHAITAWLDDGFGAIFVGTWGLGAAWIDTRDYSADLLPCGLLQKETDAIYIEGDSIWLGGNAGDRNPEFPDARYGVTLYDRRDQTFTYFEPRYINGFDSEIIYDIAGDPKNLYFAGRNGLTVLGRKDERYFTMTRRDGLPDDETTALAIGHDSVWVGTTDGLALYTPSVDTIFVVGKDLLGGKFITDLESAGGRLIIGTTKGAFYIDLARQKIGRLRDPQGNLGGLIRHISTNGDEALISSDYGLTIVNLTTGKSTPAPYVDPAGGAYAAVATDKYIAAVVDRGLMLINRQTGKERLFTEDDGLLSVKIHAMVIDGDYLWLGSEDGLTRFYWLNPARVD